MKRKISAIGENTYSGTNVEIIKNIGETHLEDCVAKTVKVIGETNCVNCIFDEINCIGDAIVERSQIEKANFLGEIIIRNTTINKANALGDVEVKETGRVKSLNVMGSLCAEYLECDNLSIGFNNDSFFGLFNKRSFVKKGYGNVELSGNINGETLESLYNVKINARLNFKNLIFLNYVSFNDELECERFYSLNKIDIESINSEIIYIRPFPQSKVNNIVGSKVTICRDFSVTDDFKKIPKNYSNNYYEDYNKDVGILEVDIIEADEIYVENINANCIRGQNIVIGKNCNIKRVEYIDELEMSKESVVNEKIKEGK